MPTAYMKIIDHPLWLVGFRPFFTVAMLAGAILPLVWALIFSGYLAPPNTSFSSFQWHAHEMFFGFGGAMLGGFLLTLTKNWVKVRGYDGAALIYLVAAWLAERLGMWFEGQLPPVLFRLSNNVFLASIVVMLLWTLLRNRHNDSFRDNYFFFILLPTLLLAKNLMLSADHFQLGVGMTLGLFRLAFLVMLERTLTQFMRGVFNVDILRTPRLDLTIKGLALILVFSRLMPGQLAGWLDLLLAVVLFGRLLFWKPQLALRRLDLGIMVLGYLAIVAQLAIEFADQVAHPDWVGNVSVHVFTLGAMGLIIPAMFIRIAKGHTGRKVAFYALDKWLLRVMILGFVLRIVAPQLYPAAYLHWILGTAACWLICFALLAWRYLPYLFQARVDGKEHWRTAMTTRGRRPSQSDAPGLCCSASGQTTPCP